jgi:hypothetical protein
MPGKIQILSILLTAGMFAIVFELVRRKRLQERYALLWLFSAAFMFALAVWRSALESLASLTGIAYPPSALFAVAFAFILVLLLHFSLVISRLSDQNKLLAQHVGRLEQRVGELETGAAREEPDRAAVPLRR